MIKTVFCLFPWKINCCKALGNGRESVSAWGVLWRGLHSACSPGFRPQAVQNCGQVGRSPRLPTALVAKWDCEGQHVLSGSFERPPPGDWAPYSRPPSVKSLANHARKVPFLMTNRHLIMQGSQPHVPSVVSACFEPPSRSSSGQRDVP